jgi:hypothetical protein
MSNNPFDSYLNQSGEDDNMFQTQELDFEHSIVDDEIEYNIIAERNQSVNELHKEMENLSETWNLAARLIMDQGEHLDVAEINVEKSEKNTSESVKLLEKAREHVKDRIIMIRDISIVVGGGILGVSGFLLGPMVGISTVIAGSAAGGAVVTGLHKLI